MTVRLVPTFARRAFVSALIAATAAAAVFGLAGRPQPLAADGPPFREPEVRRSALGVLETTLEMRTARNAIAGLGREIETFTYEGTVPAPTLRIRPGDLMKITLVNNLTFPGSPPAPPQTVMPCATMAERAVEHHGPDPTAVLNSNIHTHGLQVSPSFNGDNPFLLWKPGETCNHEIRVPADQPSGMHWYHPHLHGTTSKQLWAGMSGALIVEGDIDAIPEIAAATDRIMVIQELWIDNRGHTPAGTPIPIAGHGAFSSIPAVPTNMYYTVNGQFQPVITIRPGETQRWRILAASPHKFFKISLDGHLLYQIAQDGVPLREARAARDLLLSPGNRVEVIVQGAAAGVYQFRSLEYDQGHPGGAMPEDILATVVSSGPPIEGRLPSRLLEPEDISYEPTVARRTVVFKGSTLHAPVEFFLDGKPFDANRLDNIVTAGTVEEWTLVNEDVFQHPFHIHVNPFQVIEINEKPVSNPIWWDTFPLPAKGSIRIRQKFRGDVPGKSVYHCHILPHEDNGMMSAFLIAK